MSIVTRSNNFSKLDEINSRTGIALKDADGEHIVVVKLAVVDREDHTTGEVGSVGIIIAEDGTAYTCISGTAIETIADCVELIDEGYKLDFYVQCRPTKSGDRKFIALTVNTIE